LIQTPQNTIILNDCIWKSVAVESRKWRFSYVWMFHSWERIPRDVATIIKSALPHYHIYTSSQDTYKALGSEIKPFDAEEAMATPMHWAINVIRAGGVTVTPFLAKMMAPPLGPSGGHDQHRCPSDRKKQECNSRNDDQISMRLRI